jgi:hypothetical protein
MGYPAMTRFGGAVVAAMLLSPGAVLHHPVHEVQVVASKFMFIAGSEFCGSGHGHMKAALISIAPLSDNP